MTHVLIVGASVAGLTTAESLRAQGFDGRITLLGAERHAPYSRPALSKQVLSGEWDAAPIRGGAELSGLDATFRLGRRATGLDPRRREVAVGRERIAYDELVIATGAVPRQPFRASQTLRTIEDAHRLRRLLARGDRIAIIGAGVLGCEVASSAHAGGCAVTLIARGEGVSLGGLGPPLSERVGGLLRENGVELRTWAHVVTVDAAGVRLADGTIVGASVVVSAVGCTPAVEWLRGSGLEIADGVVCDVNGRAADGIHAVGDVAAWTDPSDGRPRRTEHQQTAILQAQAVARAIATGAASPPIEPFFWTTLFGTRILVHGTVRPDAELHVIAGEGDGDRFVFAARREGRVEALVGWNMAREFRLARADLLRAEGSLV
ncbi:FAD/NAD(P)-binding oxidoreductase [Microbacterium sp. QXD-8]|uniref:FAD/NAD(P)-binding oxidoreductase n=1 Tax=Microbacterium psychrotolerans TaxID=3068321 RepID=A0ABU0Z3K4_9MICO|nr:FAD/NAD(P)-binding oxidoreductase [Microbacterium sp. QXD-8]MDQ7879171.1 FAD/NAD(P)-binding oxidoreductase [Microbacterium sp. QXD-8]